MATRDELIALANEAAKAEKDAQKAFEALRASGSAEELVKAASTHVAATRAAKKAQHEADTFELVGVYENIRAAVVANVVKAVDMAMLAKHDIQSVAIQVPVDTDGPIEPGRIVVNTLGKRTVVKGAGTGGTRTRYVYGPEKLNSREVVEQHGADEVGAERTQATLDEPSKFGLTHLADRIAKKLDWDKTPA